MDTILTNKYPITEEVYEKFVIEKLSLYVKGSMISDIINFCEEVKQLYDIRKCYISNENVIIDMTEKMIVPDWGRYSYIKIDDIEGFNEEKFLEQYALINKAVAGLPTLKEIRRMGYYMLPLEYYLETGENIWFMCICDDDRYRSYKDLVCAYNPKQNKVCIHSEQLGITDNIFAFSVIRLDGLYNTYMEYIYNVLLKYNLLPDILSEKAKRVFKDLFELISIDEGYIDFENDKFIINSKIIIGDLIMGENIDILDKLYWNLTNILKQYCETRTIGEVDMDIKEKLLNCEKVRADIEPYEERILTDPNRGHWDLWDGQKEDSYTVQTEEAFMARNPKCDINEDGVIAIDFGTKSTIVVYQSDIEHSLPMGIGDGNLSKGATTKRYENPTVMEFVNLENFLDAYREKAGRPNTVWEDLPISHTAMEKFKNSKSEEYYAYLHQIKQWAGNREKQFRIQPINGESLILPAFIDLKEDDVNPIEIYAYYIGLYINNMRKGHGIFLDYYLSFPVTYETKIREKIIESFSKGLKKSLPESVLADEEVMKNFKVNGNISEPAAYAVCALQEYGFEPKDDEEIFYGIFDFGGGTTDFDFGLWKKSKKRRYDYRIENFGAGGDEFLGGENLLEMLAFEIFKDNQDIMLKNNYPFTLAPKSKEFIGSDALLADSQEAEKNMHNLKEKLRPYWEKDEQFNIEELRYDSIDIIKKTISQIKNASKKSVDYIEISNRLDELSTEIVYMYGNNYERIQSEIASEIGNLIYQYDIDLSAANGELEKDFIKVELFDREGKNNPNVDLKIDREKIDDFFEEKIREGVNNFFAALLLSYQNDKVKKPTVVNILLAGNSCKSPIVKKVFEEEIEKQQKNIKEKFNIKDDIGKFFEIFPPLGTEEAYKKMEERNISYNRDDLEKPTGKTGVAFGLIQCRAGGTIERVTNSDSKSEIPFQYFLGWQSKKKFVLFKDENKITTFRGKPDYNEWYQFIEADDDTFYLYYTTLPECVNGELMIDGNAAVKRIKCNIDVVNEDALVYIKALTPHSIQYAVATDYDVENNKLGKIFTKELG